MHEAAINHSIEKDRSVKLTMTLTAEEGVVRLLNDKLAEYEERMLKLTTSPRYPSDNIEDWTIYYDTVSKIAITQELIKNKSCDLSTIREKLIDQVKEQQKGSDDKQLSDHLWQLEINLNAAWDVIEAYNNNEIDSLERF